MLWLALISPIFANELSADHFIGGGGGTILGVIGTFLVQYLIRLRKISHEAAHVERRDLFHEAQELRAELRAEIMELRETVNSLQRENIACTRANLRLMSRQRTYGRRIAELETEVKRLRDARPLDPQI